MRNATIAFFAAVLILLSARPEARIPARPARIPARYCPQAPLQMVAAVRTEIGLASWYGAESSGTTASGEPFDLSALTAAHRTLPLNSRIRVTNLRNGRSVTLRVNDRGPNVEGRLLDVSRAAAELLGFVNSGEAPVRITVVSYPARYVAEPDARLTEISCLVSSD